MHTTLIYYWYRTPMLRPLLSLSIGIGWQWYAPLSLVALGMIGAGSLLLFLTLFFTSGLLRKWLTSVSLLSTGLLFFWVGAWLCIKTDIRNDPCWVGKTPTGNGKTVWEYVVNEVPIEKKRSYVMMVTVVGRYYNKNRYSASGKLLVYLTKDQQASQLQPGDTLRSARPPLLMTPPQNPGERNWQQTQLMKGITHRLYLTRGEYQLTLCSASFVWQRNMSRLRKKILDILQRYIIHPDATGLAKALLIGYRQDLDPALSRSYSNIGVIHIIAISGMHLALIGWLLSWCLRPLARWNLLKQLTQLTILGSLWLFSLLAGGAPSLLRATLLFSSVTLGEVLRQKGNSLNTLMVAGFLLLCYDPFWLWDIGFQLSFAAVAGILMIGKTLSKKLSHSKIWWHAPGQLIAISIAAQLFTTPISLYHFHQFPGAFLLGNLIAVPLSNMILTALLLLMAFSPIAPIATVIGKGIAYLIMGMNRYVRWVEEIPGLLLTDLQWELTETILLFLLLLMLLHWIVNQSHIGRLLTLLIGLTLVGYQTYRQYRKGQQQYLIVYQLPGSSVIDWIDGTRCYSFIDSGSKQDPQQLEYSLIQARRSFGIRQTIFLPKGQEFYLGKKKVWLADKQRIPPDPDSTLIDLLVVSRKAPYQAEEWVFGRRIRKVIIDGSTGPRTRERWMFLLDSMGIAVYDTKSRGAFVSSLR